MRMLMVRVSRRGSGTVQEKVFDYARHVGRARERRHVPRARQHHEPRVRQRRRELVSAIDRNDHVRVAVDDERGLADLRQFAAQVGFRADDAQRDRSVLRRSVDDLPAPTLEVITVGLGYAKLDEPIERRGIP